MIELPWGNTVLRVPIPATWRVLGNFTPAAVRPSAEPEELCRQALANPLEAAPLARRNLSGKRVLLVVDDQSRPTPVCRLFGSVREALTEAGVAPGDIEILFALGVHRPMTPQAAKAKVGEDNLAGHRWHNHDCFDPRQLTHLGTTSRGTSVTLNRLLTEFDLIVLLGLIEPHLLLGFSGGYKMIMPGCAGALTIGQNHLRGFTGERFNYVGASAEDSPVRLDLEEGAAMLRKEVFLVNAALDAGGQVVNVFCGCPRAAFLAGADFVRGHAEVSLPEPADVVLANSRPFDADLRQGMKCLGNALYAARPGGLLLGFLLCRDGRGEIPLPSWTLPYPLLRSSVRLLGFRFLRGLSNRTHSSLPIEERFLKDFGLQMLRRNDLWFFSENLPPDTGRRIGLLRQFPSVEEMVNAAVRKVGPKAAVAVFPLGGATYHRDRNPHQEQV